VIVTLDIVEIGVADATPGQSLNSMASLSDQWLMKKPVINENQIFLAGRIISSRKLCPGLSSHSLFDRVEIHSLFMRVLTIVNIDHFWKIQGSDLPKPRNRSKMVDIPGLNKSVPLDCGQRLQHLRTAET